MTRGFFTIATGDIGYYKMAFHLLESFRLFHPNEPFAILCDEENAYTKAFSKTVLLENPSRTFTDKFFMLTHCPYDENIFIEPDCLVYHDLNHFWDLLSADYDVSSFGWNDTFVEFFSDPVYAAKKFLGGTDKLLPLFTPGYLFIRKGDVARKVYGDAIRILSEIRGDPKLNNDPRIVCGKAIRDDPIFFFAMALNGCFCAAKPNEGKCVSLPGVEKIEKISLSRGILNVVWHEPMENCSILHFSSRRAKEEGLYLQQITVLRLLRNGKRSGFLLSLAESKPFGLLLDLFKKITVRIKRISGR